MAIRIITKGLSTGAVAGGVKFILRRGLSSGVFVAPTIPEDTIPFNLFIDQKKDLILFIDQEKPFTLEF